MMEQPNYLTLVKEVLAFRGARNAALSFGFKKKESFFAPCDGSQLKKAIWDILVVPPNIDLDRRGTDQFQSRRATTHSHVMKDHGRAGRHAQR